MSWENNYNDYRHEIVLPRKRSGTTIVCMDEWTQKNAERAKVETRRCKTCGCLLSKYNEGGVCRPCDTGEWF